MIDPSEVVTLATGVRDPIRLRTPVSRKPEGRTPLLETRHLVAKIYLAIKILVA